MSLQSHLINSSTLSSLTLESVEFSVCQAGEMISVSLFLSVCSILAVRFTLYR